MKNIWQDLVDEATREIEFWKRELAHNKLMAKKKASSKGIEKWKRYTFQSSSSLTKEFAMFNRQVKGYVKKLLKEPLELASWNRMHFEFSGFIKNKDTGKFAYFSSLDVRYSKDEWYENLLVRTAKAVKDYCGGRNEHCKITQLAQMAKKLTK